MAIALLDELDRGHNWQRGSVESALTVAMAAREPHVVDELLRRMRGQSASQWTL